MVAILLNKWTKCLLLPSSAFCLALSQWHGIVGLSKQLGKNILREISKGTETG